MNRNQAEQIAAGVSMMRPEWLQTSILTTLSKQQHRPARDVALALVYLAYDPSCRTPGLLATPGAHWAVAAINEATFTPPTTAEAECRTHHQRLPCGGCRAEAIAVQPEPLPPPPARLEGESFTDYRHRIAQPEPSTEEQK